MLSDTLPLPEGLGVLQYPSCLELVSVGKIYVGSMSKITRLFGFSADDVAGGFRPAAGVRAIKAVKVMFCLPEPPA